MVAQGNSPTCGVSSGRQVSPIFAVVCPPKVADSYGRWDKPSPRVIDRSIAEHRAAQLVLAISGHEITLPAAPGAARRRDQRALRAAARGLPPVHRSGPRPSCPPRSVLRVARPVVHPHVGAAGLGLGELVATQIPVFLIDGESTSISSRPRPAVGLDPDRSHPARPVPGRSPLARLCPRVSDTRRVILGLAQ